MKKGIYRTMGSFFILAGLAGMGLGAYLLLEPKLFPKNPPAESALAGKAVELCKERAREIGFSINTQDSTSRKVVTHIFGSIDNFEGLLNKSSLLITSCPSLRLTKFCFGESCKGKDGGPVLQLEFLPKPKIDLGADDKLLK